MLPRGHAPQLGASARVPDTEAALWQARAEQADLEAAVQTARDKVLALEASCFREHEATAGRGRSPKRARHELLSLETSCFSETKGQSNAPGARQNTKTEPDHAEDTHAARPQVIPPPPLTPAPFVRSLCGNFYEQNPPITPLPDSMRDTDTDEEYSSSPPGPNRGRRARSPKRARRHEATYQKPRRSSGRRDTSVSRDADDDTHYSEARSPKRPRRQKAWHYPFNLARH